MKQLLLLCFFLPTIVAAQTQVTFRVDMRRQAVSPAGVHVSGTFQSAAGQGSDWNPATTALTDADGDTVYETTLTVPAGNYEYKFINGADWSVAEIVPTACGMDDGGGNVNRQLAVGATPLQTPRLCFGACVDCDSVTVTPTPTTTARWWHDAVFYEVFVRSFYDNNGNGMGDFPGLTAKLDYLNDGNPATTTDLGVTALWLMPIMQSPSYHGYDVQNYKSIESDYGNMAQFDAFLAAAHARGIKVIIDLVLNHTSNQNSWFTQSASGAASPYRDWYIWSPTNPNYTGPWGQTVWHSRNGSYNYGLFTSSMPDLNWRKPEVRTAMWDVAKFWLAKGVDGFRLDAVKYLVENGQVMENTPETYSVLEEFEDTIRHANPEVFTVGEAWSSTSQVIPYIRDGRLNSCFEFDLANFIVGGVVNGNPLPVKSKLSQILNNYPEGRYSTFITNHDQDRALSQIGGSIPRMKLAASLYLTMPGTPFLYYGEEVGMLGTGDDANKRTPMQWTPGTNGGFTTGNPWRALNSNFATFNVQTMEADPASLLSHYKKLIAIRNWMQPLRRGATVIGTSSAAPVLPYARTSEGEAVIVAANFNNLAQTPSLSFTGLDLPAGSYVATELYTGTAAGTATVDANGSITAWAPALGNLNGYNTWIIRLVNVTAVRGGKGGLKLTLNPNPATGKVRLALPGAGGAATLRVTDVTGRTVAKARFTESHTLDVSTWPAGVYSVQVQRGSLVGTERLVVE